MGQVENLTTSPTSNSHIVAPSESQSRISHDHRVGQIPDILRVPERFNGRLSALEMFGCSFRRGDLGVDPPTQKYYRKGVDHEDAQQLQDDDSSDTTTLIAGESKAQDTSQQVPGVAMDIQGACDGKRDAVMLQTFANGPHSNSERWDPKPAKKSKKKNKKRKSGESQDGSLGGSTSSSSSKEAEKNDAGSPLKEKTGPYNNIGSAIRGNKAGGDSSGNEIDGSTNSGENKASAGRRMTWAALFNAANAKRRFEGSTWDFEI